MWKAGRREEGKRSESENGKLIYGKKCNYLLFVWIIRTTNDIGKEEQKDESNKNCSKRKFSPSANIFYHKFLLRTLQPTRFGLKQQGKKYYKHHNIPKKKKTYIYDKRSETSSHSFVGEKNAIKTTSNIIIYSTFAFFCYILAEQKNKTEKFNVA